MIGVAMTETALRVGIILMGAYAVVTGALFGVALFRACRRENKARLTAQSLPEMRSSLVDYLSGKDDLTSLRDFLVIGRSDLTSAILGFQDAVAGSARERLCALALHLQLIDEWRQGIHSHNVSQRRAAFTGIGFAYAYEPCRRAVGDILVDALADADREVRVCAARALARFGSASEVELVFRMAVRGSLVTRILVAGPLRDHATELSRSAVVEALRSDNAGQILAALEMVVAWERALPLHGLAETMRHWEPAIRIQALHAAPLVAASAENEAAMMQLLTDSDPEVAMAAASAVGRMRIAEAVPLLAGCCHSGNAAVARTAAEALAQIRGARGA